MVKGGGTPLVLPLTICDLAAISRPAALAPWFPDASCSCTSCSPTGFRLHDEAVRRPASAPSSRQEIPVSNTAGYCRDAVAELALGLTLDCLRNISACNQVVRHGGTKAGLLGHELCGKTVGIVGTGNTGIRAAQLYKAFGCRVLGYSRSQRPAAREAGVEYVMLEDLLRSSDIVSVHTPLNESTKGLISRERVGQMKQGAILINTSRGPIVDSQAVADALNSGHLAAFGTDVFETEPPVAENHPFFSAKNVVATPHVAFATVESLERRADMAFDNVAKWLDGTVQNRML